MAPGSAWSAPTGSGARARPAVTHRAAARLRRRPGDRPDRPPERCTGGRRVSGRASGARRRACPEPPERGFRPRDRFLAAAPVMVAAAPAVAVAVRLNTPDTDGHPDYSGRADAEVVRVRAEPGSGRTGMGDPRTTGEVAYTVDRPGARLRGGGRAPAGARGGGADHGRPRSRRPRGGSPPRTWRGPAGRRMRAALTVYFGFMVFLGLAFLGRFVWRNPDLWSSGPPGKGPDRPGR